MSCAERIAFERLAGWWLGDPDEALEDHLFGCADCAGRAERLAALADAVRRHVREGRLRGAVAPELLARLRADGVAVRGYELVPGGTVQCHAEPDDELVFLRLRVPAAATAAAAGPRVDLLFRSPALGIDERHEDLPLAADDAVHWVEPGTYLRTLPDCELDVRLVVPGADGDRELARYRLQHSAFAG
jgi:hypothetical protein